MSITIKTTISAILFISIQIQVVMGSELSVLSVKEFQQKEHSAKYVQEDLSKYEINNGELVELYNIKSEKIKKPQLLTSLK